MRVVVDTNVLASGLVDKTGIPGQIIYAWIAGKFTILLSHHIQSELNRTLAKPYFQRNLPPDWAVLAGQLSNRGIIVTVTTPVVGVASHPEDDLILATAVDGAAGF